jgi:hypothetical protein
MSYETGTSTGPNDLLDKLRQFLSGDGWSVNKWDDVGSGKRLHVQKSAIDSAGPEMYFNFRSIVSETGWCEDAYNSACAGLAVNGSTGYNGGSAWDRQPGCMTNPDYSNQYTAPCMVEMSLSSIPSYHFFSIGDSVHVVVETTGGKFQFMSFGCLVKQGVYTGGQYCAASYHSRGWYPGYHSDNYYPGYFTVASSIAYDGPSVAVYYDADGTADWRYRRTEGVSQLECPCVRGDRGSPTASRVGLLALFWTHAPSDYNAMAAMAPVYLLTRRSDDNFSLLGWPEGLRNLNCTMYSPGEEVVFGSDTWLVFHADSMDDAPTNMYVGFAFKKVT